MLYRLLVYIHLLAAIAWLGGTLSLAIVLVPLLRTIQGPPGAGTRILSRAARRFRVLAWVALTVLVSTGIWIVLKRGVSPADIFTGNGWFIQALRIKLALVALVLLLSALHDFVIGPRLARRLESLGAPVAGDESVRQQRRLVSWLARINLLVALAIVAVAVVLVRGVP